MKIGIPKKKTETKDFIDKLIEQKKNSKGE